MTLTVGSLCTGIGGLDLAVGGAMAWYSEVDENACLIVNRNWTAPNLGDLTVVDWREVEPVDVLTAGYPCQPFSSAGRRQGESDVRHLWPHVAEAVRVLRPRWVVLENVAGHVSLGFGAVLGDLAEAGFDAEWGVFRASDVGAPHSRARVFIVARDADHARTNPHATPGRPRGATGESGGVAADPERADRRAATGVGGTEGQHMGSAGWVKGAAPPCGDRTALADTDTSRSQRAQPEGRRDVSAWGDYGPAITRWEAVLGRPAPAPTDDRGRLNPVFVEWMMGYPEGWVDGLARAAALKVLGNAVVPQQGALAVSVLADALAVAA